MIAVTLYANAGVAHYARQELPDTEVAVARSLGSEGVFFFPGSSKAGAR
jgi:hypothetical protein